MYSNIVKCECDTLVRVSHVFTACPNCEKKLYIVEGYAYIVQATELIPTPIVFSFPPSKLKYFRAVYPKSGERVLIIKDNNECIIDFWNKIYEEKYEESLLSNVKKPMMLSWI